MKVEVPSIKEYEELLDRKLAPVLNLLNQIAGDNQSLKPKMGLLDTEAAANYLGMSVGWLQNKRSEGDGPKFIKLGHKVKYQIEDLETFKRERLRKHTADPGE